MFQDDLEDDHHEDDHVAGPSPPKRKPSQELREFLQGKKSSKEPNRNMETLTTSNLLAEIKKEMKIFASSGQRGEILEKVEFYRNIITPLTN